MYISHIYFSVHYLTLENLNAVHSAHPSVSLNDGDNDSDVTLTKTPAVQEDKDKTATDGSCSFINETYICNLFFVIVFLLF